LDESNVNPRRERIRSYALFGESARFSGVVHCETIEARSVLHDWNFEPHRHAHLHQLLLVESGGGTAHLDGDRHALHARSLVNVPSSCVHAFRFARGTRGFVATLADELVEELLAASPESRGDLGVAGVVRASAALRNDARQVWREFNGRSAARSLLLRGLCATLLGRTARQLAAARTGTAGTREPQLLRRFRVLLEAHYAGQWRVTDYARALAVTPTHLSRVIRAATGESASQLIDERVMREARRNLAYTSLRVSTIAYSLGYSDPAYFTRAFTRSAGLSPSRFRAQS
jgi:AraC family transcriptional regulator, transcriptional activator of pobA